MWLLDPQVQPLRSTPVARGRHGSDKSENRIKVRVLALACSTTGKG